MTLTRLGYFMTCDAYPDCNKGMIAKTFLLT